MAMRIHACGSEYDAAILLLANVWDFRSERAEREMLEGDEVIFRVLIKNWRQVVV